MINGKKFTAIVLSAGKGRRMQSAIPKQYLMLGDRPVLAHSLLSFEKSNVDEIVIVSGEGDEEFVKKEIVDKYSINKVTRIVAGGAERYNSVSNGISMCGQTDYILIHDGARPYISVDTINKNIEEVYKYPALVTAVPVTDTIKMEDGKGYVDVTLDRKLLWSIQTPQTFEYQLIKKSYEAYIGAVEANECDVQVTDDASVVELFSDIKVKIVQGEYNNIKITNPGDLNKSL